VSLCQSVEFELADHAAAQALARRLRPARLEWLESRDGLWLVTAELRPVPGDLAVLLREAEAWLDETGLADVAFRVDGRWYWLRRRRDGCAAPRPLASST
jgi:hypothetical protein